MPGIAPLPQLPEPVLVRRRQRETADTWTLELKGNPAAAFLPGQFNMLSVPGVGESAISISGDPADPARMLQTIRAVGPVSAALAALRPGQALGLRGPFGRGWPLADVAGRDVLLVAGGLGLAPLRPALYALLARRREIGRLALLYGSRGPDDLVYRRELARWQRRRGLEVGITVDHAPSGWTGEVGVVTRLLDRLEFDPARLLALVCGPELMMRHTARSLLDRAVPATAIWISMERNMKCALAHCGRCQFGGALLCRDGPVLRYDQAGPLLAIREL
jgi:NAD(P)H-flavin reductase